MVAALLGKKIGMTQVFDGTGRAVPVTVIEAGPCTVLQVKTAEADGYEAVQLGFGDVRPHRSTMALIGHAAKAGVGPKRFVREVRVREGKAEAQIGDTWTVDVFDQVQFVDIIGTTKGHGTAGVMRRHHFGGQPASHGTERKHRSPGSIASHGTDRGHGGNPKKGKRMAGQMGNARRTSRHHTVVGVDKVRNLILVRGGIPGPNGGQVMIRASVAKSQPKEISRVVYVLPADSAEPAMPAKVDRLVKVGADGQSKVTVGPAGGAV
jgi:large subunit ribosomal protein L3